MWPFKKVAAAPPTAVIPTPAMVAKARTNAGIRTNGRRFAHGQCSGCIDQHQFWEKLAALGLEVEERNYSINVSEFECLTFEFEWDTDDLVSIEGTAATDAVLRNNAYRLHEVLTRGGIRHWIEITDDVQNRLEYLHHQWPDEDCAQHVDCC